MCYGRVVCSKIQALIGPGFGILGVTAKHQAELPCYDKWPVDAAFIFHLQNCLRAPRPPRGPLIAVQAPSSSSACIARGKFERLIPTSAHCKCRFVFRLSRKPGFQDALGSHREKALGNKVLAYIESPLMKARLLFSLPQYRSFLKQQGQLNRHTLACKKREKISFPAPNKMVNLAIAKQEPGYEGDLKETPAWEENSKHGACFGRLSLLLPRPPSPDVGSAHPLPAPHRCLLGGLQHHAGGLPP